jgi:hypothetical protein
VSEEKKCHECKNNNKHLREIEENYMTRIIVIIIIIIITIIVMTKTK